MPSDGFRWTSGRAVEYQSSAEGWRYHCGRCGTQLAFRTALDSATIDLVTATVDGPPPELCVPTAHIFWADGDAAAQKLLKGETEGGLLRHPGYPPE